MRANIKKIIPPFLKNWYHFLWALMAALFCRFPSKHLVIVGVTGTKGKTTVVNLAGKILEEAGFKVGWISSATLKIGEKEWLNPYHMTMPGRFFIQKFLREMVRTGCQYALIEVTSEGILQHRHRFINFNTAVLTNLAPEHLEAHGGFENYKRVKGELFKSAKNIHIVNLDDKNADYFLQFPAKEKYGFKVKNHESGTMNQEFLKDVKISEAKDLKLGEKNSLFIIHNSLFKTFLLGEFNVYNSLAAIYVGLSQGVSLEVCQRALEKIKGMPGRMEVIDEGQNFRVIVDLAHTPGSFEQVFQLVKNLPHQRIISIFGSAGGGRDKWKRPELGKIAVRYSDFIILTNEDSYEENPNEIINQIESGIEGRRTKVFKILDRREAIKKALSLAEKDDVVLILGKGTEQVMVIGPNKIPWDDRVVAREELKNFTPLESLFSNGVNRPNNYEKL